MKRHHAPQVCPYGLPIVDLLEEIKEGHILLLDALQQGDWASVYADAISPFPESVMKLWT